MRFLEIAEADIRIQNPFSEIRLMQVGRICYRLGHMRPGTRFLDLACGQGEMLCRWAQLYEITGTGVDINETFLVMARQRAEELGVATQVEFVRDDASKVTRYARAYDVVSCVGATWIGGSPMGNIDLMRQALKDESRGLLLLGELFWDREPSQAAAEAMGVEIDQVPTLPGMYDLFDQAGVRLLNMVLADQEGWDRYQTYQWMEIDRWLRECPDDPDAAEFRDQIEGWKRSYLTYRGHFGWGVFILGVKES